jgi:hypothetical protein
VRLELDCFLVFSVDAVFEVCSARVLKLECSTSLKNWKLFLDFFQSFVNYKKCHLYQENESLIIAACMLFGQEEYIFIREITTKSSVDLKVF